MITESTSYGLDSDITNSTVSETEAQYHSVTTTSSGSGDNSSNSGVGDGNGDSAGDGGRYQVEKLYAVCLGSCAHPSHPL